VVTRLVSLDDFNPAIPGAGINRYAYSANDSINKQDRGGNTTVYYWVADPVPHLQIAEMYSGSSAAANYGLRTVDSTLNLFNSGVNLVLIPVLELGHLAGRYGSSK
jgi:hypothetical protein